MSSTDLDRIMQNILRSRVARPTFECARHGTYSQDPTAGTQDRNACPECQKAGREKERAWAKEWRTYNRWQRSLAPARFRNRRFENFRTETSELKRALLAAQAVAKGNVRALALIGSVGTGKTHLSVAIAAEVVRAGQPCLWVTVPELFRCWKQTFVPGAARTEQQFIDRINAAELLVLDEIGMGNRSDWEAARMFELVDHRYRGHGRLVLTGNCGDLASAIGSPASDRIDEMGVCVQLTGPSYRTRASDDMALRVEDDFTKPPKRIEWTVCDSGIDRQVVRDTPPKGW